MEKIMGRPKKSYSDTLSNDDMLQPSKNEMHAIMNYSELDIDNKDPNFSYSFINIEKIEKGGGMAPGGWRPLSETNNSGETWNSIYGDWATDTNFSFRYEDTILCRRPKRLTEFFGAQENRKYNANINLINNIGKGVRERLRSLDPNAKVDDSKNTRYTQRVGPTME